MTKHSLFIVFGILISRNSSGQTGPDVYMNFCSGCHGPRLEGAKASPLIKSSWQFGSDRNSIIKVIRDGIPNTDMPKWSEILSADEIRATADFIIKSQKKKPSTKKKD